MMTMSYIPIFVALVLTKAVNVAGILNPKLLFYTPGLWGKTGIYFWRAFLFEMPFAIMRVCIWIFFPAMIIMFIIFAIKAKKYYRDTNLEHLL